MPEGNLTPAEDRRQHAIADAAVRYLPQYAQMLLGVQRRLARLPGSPRGPEQFDQLAVALEESIRDGRHAAKAVKRVEKHLDVLRDGLTRLRTYDAELTDVAIRSVNGAHEILSHQAAQLMALGIDATDLHDAAARVATQLAGERPWRGIDEVQTDLDGIRSAYTAERQRLLQWQERQTEEARLRVTGRLGFTGLTADQAHRVQRPLSQAAADTDAEAVAPTLLELKDPFLLRLGRAEDEANGLLDAILSEGTQPLITRLDLGLKNREVSTEADVDALLSEIRNRLLPIVRTGGRVRLQ